MGIINCHTHTFTVDHVPNKFIQVGNIGLVKLLSGPVFNKPFSWFLRNILPFTDRDLLDRYANFVELTANKSQEDTFTRIREYYPSGTKFIILPMDMRYMAAGKMKCDLEAQLDDLNALYKKFPDLIFPFVAVDPRRENILDILKKYVSEHKFKGIKLYPRLGFYPTDKRLWPIYEFAQKENIPVLSHCSRGGVYTKKITKEMLAHPSKKVKKSKARDFSNYFCEPQNYQQVLEDFPELRICLAHFGGNLEWDKFLENAWDPLKRGQEKSSWVAEIVDMMRRYPNLYTDISYTAFSSDRYFPLMSIYLDDPQLREKILFGSDFYMVEREKISEREMSLRIRYALGKEKFDLISGQNVEKFLGIYRSVSAPEKQNLTKKNSLS